MQEFSDPDAGTEINFFIDYPELEVDVAHYLRQIAITRRRHAPWINLVWCQTRRLPAKASQWKR